MTFTLIKYVSSPSPPFLFSRVLDRAALQRTNTSPLETGYFRLPWACSLIWTQAALLNLNSKCDLESSDCNSDLFIHPWRLWSEKHSRGLIYTEPLQEQINRPYRDLNLCWFLMSLSLSNTHSPFYVQPLKLIRIHFWVLTFSARIPAVPNMHAWMANTITDVRFNKYSL